MVALKECCRYNESSNRERGGVMDTQCKNKEIIRAALDGSEKGLVCFVWNDEYGSTAVALIKLIGRSSGHYIDCFYRSWLYAEPVNSDDCFFIDLEVV